jgi:hypothetical protein
VGCERRPHEAGKGLFNQPPNSEYYTAKGKLALAL